MVSSGSLGILVLVLVVTAKLAESLRQDIHVIEDKQISEQEEFPRD